MGILTYKGNTFLMDGKPYKILSGAMHYFRIPKEYWRDRLQKLKECGFNTVETYTCWNLHEPSEGVFDFSGRLDIETYIDTAAELGLNVILRPGPYICAEWDFGGLPAWLLNYESMPLRCYNEVFLSKVRRYYKELLGRVAPRLCTRGGNVIMLQVENEYGSYGNDKKYLRAIAEIYKEMGCDCLFFTSDGGNNTMLRGGGLPEYIGVANFGSGTEVNIGALRRNRPDQPAMCGEFWCGWFDHWFEGHHVRTPDEICGEVEEFFRLDASLNFYMFHGGTNFGFTNGANYHETYQPTVTSYDYNALLTEAGDRTESYYRVREMFEKHMGPAPALTAKESRKAAYGSVPLKECAPLFDHLEELAEPIESAAPGYMETYGQNFGYILYRTRLIGTAEPHKLVIEKVHDRAQIFEDGVLRGTYERWQMPTAEQQVEICHPLDEETRLDILAENMGRVNYGDKLRDHKGINGLRLDYQHHFGWQVYCLPMEDLSRLTFAPGDGNAKTPTFFRAELQIEGEPADTFVRMDGLHKGFVTVNGFNLGRYFNDAGPQKTLYVPAPVLRPGKNEIIVFESDSAEAPTLVFLDKPELGDPIPKYKKA